MALEIGTLLHKRYRIVENLAQGGMGSVYHAMDETLGIMVAVKENLFTTEEAARQFRLEAIILANLRHPNLPRVTDHFTIDGQGQYLVMDFIEGEDLRERMERLGVIPEDDVILIGAAMCDALTYLHTRTPPILHRDIKPGNVKIAPNGHIVLLDFGLAKIVQGDQATTVGARAMTPGYSPPEQYGTARTDPRSDIYSLGATLYAAVSGAIPEDGLARAMENAELSPLRKRNPSTSRKFALAIEKAMSVDPLDRYQTAEEFKRALLASKSKTQQPVGAYAVAPPPVGEAQSAAEELSLPARPISAAPLLAEDIPFLSPRKRQNMRATRMRRAVIIGLSVLLVAGYFLIDRFSPGLIQSRAGQLFGVLTTTSAATATTDMILTSALSASATADLVMPPDSPTPTEAAAPSPTEAVVPTPMGAEKMQLAFASTRTGVAQLFIADLDGHTTQLTHLKDGACQPDWSPDGQQLVFISPCTVRQDVYRGSSLFVINADGSGLRPLNTVPGGDFEPAWSPKADNGMHIAFTSVRTGHMQIYSYDIKSGISQRLIRTLRPIDARQPAWSPDGKWIAFARRRTENSFEIWKMPSKLGGQDPEPLVRAGDQFSTVHPEWSPDGTVLLFTQVPAQKFGFPRLATLNMDSTPPEIVNVNMNLLSINNVDYSSNGVWLAFEYNGERGTDIYYSTATGAGSTPIAADPADDFDPAWRPIQP